MSRPRWPALGAIGLAVSTLTEHAIGAIATVMILVVASEVVDNGPQLAAAGPYLPTHWWLSFDALLRAGRHIHPAPRAAVVRGLHADLRLLRLGALHLGRRHQLKPGKLASMWA